MNYLQYSFPAFALMLSVIGFIGVVRTIRENNQKIVYLKLSSAIEKQEIKRIERRMASP